MISLKEVAIPHGIHGQQVTIQIQIDLTHLELLVVKCGLNAIVKTMYYFIFSKYIVER